MTDPVAAYRAALADTEVWAFPIDALDRLGVPVWAASLWTPEGLFCNGVGYGHDTAAAQASAWGELAEAAFAARALAATDPVVGSFAALSAEHEVLDPRVAPLPAGSPWAPTDERPWATAYAQPDGRPVLVPFELAATRPAEFPAGFEPLFTPVTNGLGAGLTREQAIRHGVGEILQRDGNSVSFRALDRGIAVDLDGLEDPVARELLARYDEAGVEVIVKFAGTSCGVASVYVVGYDRHPADPLVVGAAGEAAHPRREVAIRKALLEFASSRARRIFSHSPFERLAGVLPPGYLEHVRAQPRGAEEDRALRATQAMAAMTAAEAMDVLAPVFAVRERVPLSALPDGDAPDLDGLEVLWLPFADGDVAVGKAFVPGLEVESLSYGRVGPRNLERLLSLGVDFAGTGPAPEGARPLNLVTGATAWLHPERMQAAVGPLYALYREPGRHAAALAAELA